MVLDVALLNTQHYKVEIKGKIEQSKEWSSTLSYTIEKGAFASPLTKVTNFSFLTFNSLFKLRTYAKLNCLK